MVDIHCHILPGIDDGAQDIETSSRMLKIAANEGTSHIIATPHFIHAAIDNNAAVVGKSHKELEKLAENENMDIKIYPGNEVFLSPEIPELIGKHQICTLNGSYYILIEFPMMSIPVYTKEILYQLRLDGYTPIIAHPERYGEIAKDPNILNDFIERGALIQVNSTSLIGIYGDRIKRLSMTLLKHGMVHFVASDAHTCRGRSPKLKKCRGIVDSEMGREMSDTLFEINGFAVIENREIKVAEPERVSNRRSFYIPLLKKITSVFSTDRQQL
jgi:protein-tyrosine phosphatase